MTRDADLTHRDDLIAAVLTEIRRRHPAMPAGQQWTLMQHTIGQIDHPPGYLGHHERHEP